MYVFCLLVWGLNFIAVKLQGDLVSLEVSLAYRLMGAAAIFSVLCILLRSQKPKFSRDFLWIIAFGVCNFAVSYLCLYHATMQSSAAMVTMIFSMKTVITPLLLHLILRKSIEKMVFVGGAVGCAGVGVLVWPNVIDTGLEAWWSGLLLAIGGTFLTALGDVCSARNSEKKIDPIFSNSIGFLVASLFLVLWSVANEKAFLFPDDTGYWSALLYLTVFASVLAWWFYLKLVTGIGATRASYIVAFFPVVGAIGSLAIGESSFSPSLVVACVLCCLGAILALPNAETFKRVYARYL